MNPFDAHLISLAQAAGRPVRRLALSPWTAIYDDTFVQMVGGKVRPSNNQSLHFALSAESTSRVVLRDRVAAKAYAAGLANVPVEPFMSTMDRRFDLLTSQGVSNRVVVLADALATVYQAPVSNPTLQQWAGWFGCTDATEDLWRTALLAPSDGNPAAKLWAEAESQMLHQYARRSSANSFIVAGRAAERWNGLCKRDRIMRDRFVAKGDVVKVLRVSVENGMTLVRLTSPCKLKPGRVMLAADDREGEVTLKDVTFSGGCLTARVVGIGENSRGKTSPSAKSASSNVLTALRSAGTGYITESGFNGRITTKAISKRWANTRNTQDRAGVPPLSNLPLEILIAGSVDR